MGKDISLQRIYLVISNSREGKKFASGISGSFIIDIPKIIKDLGYSDKDLRKEAEYIITSQIERKLKQGIYSSKWSSLVIINTEYSNTFEDNIKGFVYEHVESFDIETVIM